MDWRRIIKSRWVPTGGAVFSAPGLLDDFEFWRNAVGDMNAGWQGALIGIGGLAVAFGMFVMVCTYWEILRAHWKDLAWLAVSTLMAIGLIGAASYVIFIREPGPKMAWVHPTLSTAEQEREKARCRMRALEVVGASLNAHKAAARKDYKEDCLIQKGFVREEARDDR